MRIGSGRQLNAAKQNCQSPMSSDIHTSISDLFCNFEDGRIVFFSLCPDMCRLAPGGIALFCHRRE